MVVNVVLILGLSLGLARQLVAQPLVFLVQAPPWASPAQRFDARPLARQMSRTLGREVQVRRSEDALSHWRAVRSAGDFDLVFDEAHFTAYRVSHHAFQVLAQAASETRFAVVVRARTLVNAPSDLSARKIATPAPPALAALHLLNLFPNPARAPVLVAMPGRAQALRALLAGEVSAVVLPVSEVQSLHSSQIALETNASPGRGFSVSAAISSLQQRKLLVLFAELNTSAHGRGVLAQLAETGLLPASNAAYEDAEQLLKGTWGY